MINQIFRTENESSLILHILGRLDSVEGLETILVNILKELEKKDEHNDLIGRLIIDLTGTVLITDDCLKVLKKYNKKYLTEYVNYSLYVELLLKEYGLIKEQAAGDS
jgi:hypothetical protein